MEVSMPSMVSSTALAPVREGSREPAGGVNPSGRGDRCSGQMLRRNPGRAVAGAEAGAAAWAVAAGWGWAGRPTCGAGGEDDVTGAGAAPSVAVRYEKSRT